MSKVSTIDPKKIVVLPFVARPFDKIADFRDSESIRKTGVQQPLVVVPDGKRLLLAKGLRRLRIATGLKLAAVPYVVALPPKGVSAEDYVRELRLALSFHRQDLTPSQKCDHITELKARFRMNNKQVAQYLGIDQDTVTNIMDIRHYIAPVVKLLDKSALTMKAARVFNGMTEKGQETLLKKHFDDLRGASGVKVKDIHRELREQYPPEEFPAYYRNPANTAERMARKKGPRKGKAPAVTDGEKRRLLNSVDMRETETRTGTKELKRLEREILAATVPIAAIMRHEQLWAMVPDEMKPELERFSEVYV